MLIDTPIPPLYHYTNYNGFLGMLESKSLWFTHINYQNDLKEYYHALELIEEVIKKSYPDIPLEKLKLSKQETYPVYTFSLTSEKNLLSQWRGYCPDGGVSYSLNFNHIQEIMKTRLFRLVECLYEESKKVELIQNTVIGVEPIDYATKGWRRLQSHMVEKYFKRMNQRIARYAGVMKDEAFAGENEWRILTVEREGDLYESMANVEKNIEVKVRERNNVLIPYKEVPLINDDFKKVKLDEVVIGPTANAMHALSAANYLLRNYEGVLITDSKIPYRK